MSGKAITFLSGAVLLAGLGIAEAATPPVVNPGATAMPLKGPKPHGGDGPGPASRPGGAGGGKPTTGPSDGTTPPPPPKGGKGGHRGPPPPPPPANSGTTSAN